MSDRIHVGDKMKDSLKGWEFTPAMQQKVMQRIREREPEARPVRPPYKALAWTAAAAAAFVIGINLAQFGGVGPRTAKQEAPQQDAMQSQESAAQMAAPSAPMEQASAAKSAEMKAESLPNAEPTAESGQRSMNATALSADVVTIALPAASVEGQLTVLIGAKQDQMLSATAADGLLAAGPGPGFAFASGFEVQVYDGSSKVRTLTLTDARITGLALVAPEGPVAVGINGERVELHGTTVVSVPGRGFALSPTDGALAVTDGQQVTVYRGGRAVWSRAVEGAPDAIAFAGDILVAGGTAMDAQTGDVRWTHDAGGRPAAANAELFVRWTGEGLHTYRIADGAAVWHATAAEGEQVTAVAANAGLVAVLADRNGTQTLTLLDAGGGARWAVTLSTPARAVAVDGAGRVLILTPDGAVAEVRAPQ